VVNIASTEAIVTTSGLAAYAATKAGVVGLTKSFAVELGRHGVTVNCICPGPIETGMTSGIPDEAKLAYAKRRVPLRRYGQPEEVAHMTVSLCLPASSFVNGAVIPVDGGMSIRHT
jgi:3-oxoacyl-[acyl-carrier protein] reductase